jgi:hypothetical protein
MKCRIAQLNIEINNRFDYLAGSLKPYLCDFDKADITVSASDADLAAERESLDESFSDGYVESIAVCRKICHRLPEFSGYMLHSATFSLEGHGIGFLAKSGTGKSTHMLLWKQLFGDSLRVINGDKPFIRLEEGIPWAYGTPWCGKEGLNLNDRVALTDLCFIRRSCENKTVPISPEKAVGYLLEQVIIPEGSANIIKVLDMLDATVKNCRLWEIYCNTDISAAEVSAGTILEVK